MGGVEALLHVCRPRVLCDTEALEFAINQQQLELTGKPESKEVNGGLASAACVWKSTFSLHVLVDVASHV